jgi:hypothetical protein
MTDPRKPLRDTMTVASMRALILPCRSEIQPKM